MKKFARAVSSALALSLVLGTSAFAASVEDVTAVVDHQTKLATVSGAVADPASGQDMTLLVIKKTSSLSNLTEADLAYIDQKEMAEDQTFSFPVSIDSEAKGIRFTAYVGGTEVQTVSSAPLDLIAMGDLNDDGEVDTADAVLLLRGDSLLEVLQPNQVTVSDYNEDGVTNIADAILILQQDAGLN